MKNLNNYMEYLILNDITNINESFQNWWNKFIAYGTKGLLTSFIIISLAFSNQVKSQRLSNKVIEKGIELSNDNTNKDVYCFMIGICKKSQSLSIQNGNIDDAAGYKELSIYYENMRDDKIPNKLSNNAKRCLNNIIYLYDNLDKNTIYHFILDGKNIKTLKEQI